MTISDSDLHVWQIRDKKLINKGTGREYSYDTSKQGYNLDGVIIEDRYIEDYLNTSKDQWKFCHEEDETFRIKCTSSGSFLRAKSDNDQNHIIKGNFSFLLKASQTFQYLKKKKTNSFKEEYEQDIYFKN